MNLKLDRLRPFGQIVPPEQLTCFEGRSIATAMRDRVEGDPDAYEAFMEAAQGRHRIKTRCYEQDGFSFDAAGDLIEEALDEPARRRALFTAAQAAASAAAKAAHAAALAEAGFGDVPSLGETPGPLATNLVPPTTSAVTADTLDIPAYFRGDVTVPWFAVKKAIEVQYGIKITPPADRSSEKEAARQILIEAGQLPALV